MLYRVIAYLQDFADKRQLQHKQDNTGNIVIQRPGSGGGEAAPTVVIQVWRRNQKCMLCTLLPFR